MSDFAPVGDGRYLAADVFAEWGIRALATTRAAGSFSNAADEPVAAVMGRWSELQRHLFPHGEGRFATAHQVHGADVVDHVPGWAGWLRASAADGHLSPERGTAMAVTVADCVPVYVAHPSGATAMLHAGWRGTAAGILGVAVRRLAALRRRPSELRVLLGPAVCGRCYEVSPDVYQQLTGRAVDRPTTVALHDVLADQARALGVRDVHATALCTRCDNDRLFSHRAGDGGRQLGVLVADAA
ncbi:polyphenol oxidase family protein [Roseisolibacter sp. H3M3-2]|uniref:polyphenol oxidase family protein n=1 Tax=Roseisolibacter sp. H3M3-2 TaxID=3031323 RepID=UPI0023DA9603|nr:polyphenol oxidase family protein [Roseisolibacter sp. H3M3-2]MDF1502512.1 polyphenol oxidase family protein [Roseisolibacter sp. H3M3-2]